MCSIIFDVTLCSIKRMHGDRIYKEFTCIESWWQHVHCLSACLVGIFLYIYMHINLTNYKYYFSFLCINFSFMSGVLYLQVVLMGALVAFVHDLSFIALPCKSDIAIYNSRSHRWLIDHLLVLAGFLCHSKQ